MSLLILFITNELEFVKMQPILKHCSKGIEEFWFKFWKKLECYLKHYGNLLDIHWLANSNTKCSMSKSSLMIFLLSFVLCIKWSQHHLANVWHFSRFYTLFIVVFLAHSLFERSLLIIILSSAIIFYFLKTVKKMQV